jgi:hypothetical protein
MFFNITWNDWKFLWYGGPLAHIIKEKNIVLREKINLMGKFFINHLGVFIIDSEMQYVYAQQPVFWYNSHGIKTTKHVTIDGKNGKKLKKDTVKLMYHYYKKKQDEKLLQLLRDTFEFDRENKTTGIFEALQKIVEKQQHYPIDLDTDKYMPDFIARNPMGALLTVEIAGKTNHEIDHMYPSLKAPLPLIAIMIGMVIFVVIWKDLPNYAQQIMSALGFK